MFGNATKIDYRHERSGAHRLLIGMLVATILCAISTTALATPSTDFSYFDTDAIVLDFNEIPMTQSTVITNQYAATGVTFSPNVWFENHRGSVGWDAHNIANFLTSTTIVNTTVDFVFSGTVSGAAFEWASNTGSSFLLEAIAGGSVVESFTHNQAGCCAAQVLGFEDIDFDTLRVTHQSGSDFFIADRLTWQPVPEPSTALFLGLGLIGMAAFRRVESE